MNTETKTEGLVLELITGLGLGGAERVVVELTREIARCNIDVRLISLTNDTRILSQYPGMGGLTHVFELQKNPFQFLRALQQIRKITASYRMVIVHAHMFHALVVAVALKLLRPSISIVFTSHNYGGFTLPRKLFVKLTRRLRISDIIFAADQHPEMNAAVAHIIPNFAPRIVTLSSFHRKAPASNKPIVFAFIGRMVATKNPLAIVEAFKSLPTGTARLLMVGDGPLLADVKAYVAHNDLESDVDVLGPRNDVGMILNTVDVLVMASVWEGLPMVILEAGSRGIAVIAPPVGAIPELLANGCGYVALPSNLASALQQVCRDFEDAISVGMRLKQKIETSYSCESALRKHLQAYRIHIE